MNADPARPCDTCGAIVGHAPCCKIPYMEKPWLSSDPAVREAWISDCLRYRIGGLTYAGIADKLAALMEQTVRELWQALDEARKQNDQMAHDLKGLRRLMDCDGSAYEQLAEAWKARTSERDAAVRERDRLREKWAISYAGVALYTDDGELQDNRVHPFIDFKRDSVEEIERKILARTALSREAGGKEEVEGG